MRQQVMILYTMMSALDTPVVAWAFYDGTGETRHMSGDCDEPPYATGLAALKDGWRLIQASPIVNRPTGDEFRTDYLQYEFFFEKLIGNLVQNGFSKAEVNDGDKAFTLLQQPTADELLEVLNEVSRSKLR